MIKSKSELEKTVRAMLPSRDLRRYLRERKIALGEKDMLKLIDFAQYRRYIEDCIRRNFL